MRTLANETAEKIGKQIILKGWIQTRRDHGKIVFFDIRDRSGLVQVVAVTQTLSAPLQAVLKTVGPEDVAEITGLVKKRPDALINPNLTTGTVEVELKDIQLLNKARELPFPIDTDGYAIDEELRNKYRYLDIRRPRMTRNLRTRSAVTNFIRNFLTARDFIEVETPILTKTTPEGARDFVVPSRLQKGKFYALPQSPQQYKQLLMVAGLERYFQITRCFRDEDPRADRAYGEFTQLDLEMSFVTQEDILRIIEEMFTKLVTTLFPQKRIKESPWPRLPHAEVMKKYRTDKPDLRTDKNDPDELAFSWTIDFPLFTEQSKEDFYYGSGSAKFAPSHHMFTAPHPEDISLLETDPTKVRGLQHDLVLNGYEVGGGSIRIHQAQVQEKVFDLIGFSVGQKKQFAHMLTAFTYGVPPHGGIAPGIDRFLMAVLGEPSVREVMAFPTSASGKTSVMDAPSELSSQQMKELGISLVQAKTESLYERIVALLESGKVSYKTFEHAPVYTSADAAKVRDTALFLGAKALVFIADKKPIMLVVPADKKADLKAFKLKFNIKDLRMATAEEVKQITTVEIGAVAPFGNLMQIPTYMEESMRTHETMVFNAGLHTKSISMHQKDYEKLVGPIIGSFAKT